MLNNNETNMIKQTSNEDEEEIKIEALVSLQRVMFPKEGYSDGDFAIVSVMVEKAIEGVPKLHPVFKGITIKGNLCVIEEGLTYKVIAKELYDEKYKNYSYQVQYIQEIYNFDSIENQKIFLGRILSDKLIGNLYQEFDNPIAVIESGNLGELCKVKGIGEVTAERIIDKYNITKDYSKAYVELEAYNLTNNMINKLVSFYGSPEIVIAKVKANPYILATEIDGIGFAKADEMALASGYSRHSLNRCKAFVLHYMNDKANNGDSFVDTSVLFDTVLETLGFDLPSDVIKETLQQLSKKELWHNKDKTIIALRKLYELERNIAKHIIRLHTAENTFEYGKWRKRIAEQEEKQGWRYTDEQMASVKAILEKNVVVVQGGAGCVDCDTEFFDGYGWKKISEYEQGDKVLQYDINTNLATLVSPSRYIKDKQDTLYHIKSKTGIDQCLSLDHTMLLEKNSNGKLYTTTTKEYIERHKKTKLNIGDTFPTTFDYQGTKEIDLTDDELRLMCAVMADGHFGEDKENCRISVKKERKQKRLESLLANVGLEYRKDVRDGTELGYIKYYFNAPLIIKSFPKEWYECPKRQKEIIIDEIVHWDGRVQKTEQGTASRHYFTTNKSDADFVQFLYNSVGIRSTISIDDRVGEEQYAKNGKTYIRKSICYTVTTARNKNVGMMGKVKYDIPEYKTKDGYQYCFTVPSEFLVLRRNNKIFVTGNCGKTASVSGVISVLGDGYTINTCALSGKASINLSTLASESGNCISSSTIHRLLNYNPRSGFVHNENNPLVTDIVILDELSMVDGYLFLTLLKAIPTGAKLIMLGDTGQLESIGACNIMHDLLESGYIEQCTLTKVHRQASKSAIITESFKIRNGEQIVPPNFDGSQIMGELQDLELIGFKDSPYREKDQDKATIQIMFDKYKELYKIAENVNDIVTVLPTKSRGTSCYKMNLLLQSFVLPTRMLKGITIGSKGKHPYTLYTGDRVINRKNDYKANYIYMTKDEFGYDVEVKEERQIFNGNMGTIKSIDHDRQRIVVDFDNIGLVTIIKKSLENIELGYCITCHSAQGSGIPYVIAGLDYSHYSLLTREMAYTQITRAKKHCVFVFETKALRKAISTTNIRYKSTFLPYFLRGELDVNVSANAIDYIRSELND